MFGTAARLPAILGTATRLPASRLVATAVRPEPIEYEDLHAECVEELTVQGWLTVDGQMVEPSSTDAGAFVSYFNEVVLPLRRSFAWGVPTTAALACIAEHAPHGVVEIGAGT